MKAVLSKTAKELASVVKQFDALPDSADLAGLMNALLILFPCSRSDTLVAAVQEAKATGGTAAFQRIVDSANILAQQKIESGASKIVSVERSPPSVADIFQLGASVALKDLLQGPGSRFGLATPLVLTPIYLVVSLLLCGQFPEAALLYWTLEDIPESLFTLADGLEKLSHDLESIQLVPKELVDKYLERVRLGDSSESQDLAHSESMAWKGMCELVSEALFEAM